MALTSLIYAGISAASEAQIVDMCSFPELPKEIKKAQSDLEKIVTTTPRDKEFLDQWDKYMNEKEKFNLKYQEEIQKVKLEWEAVKEKMHPSELKFNTTTSAERKNEPLLEDVKSTCWANIMGVDETAKYRHCNPLKKTPSRSDWNNMLTCTFEKANLLNIELYR